MHLHLPLHTSDLLIQSQARGALVRSQVTDVTAMIDDVVRDIDARDGLGDWRGQDRWDELSSLFSRLDRLLGALVPGKAR